ncbi:Rieske 2Fe-2S domain-containing protein [Synechococcus sp. CBW1004]|uniref:aromatic ring-hydroxylating dioxygenase subunit alpha n=1 Tax=Synechococcus sp. CBW1004 TaxID=1353136 RepID=UPI0018CF7990|nr:Rieske 2Fe-2S domain-containing protein [Synechococcus sp. CBW1004]QPN63391.1 Rieske 2Fe-2S domain-containing protein [Synechococcus sp. CBW1004]
MTLTSSSSGISPSSGSSPGATDPWRQAWYPVAYLSDLDPDRPTPFTLLGEDLVLWFDRQEAHWRAFTDVCPHRLVPLSDGRLNEKGELECPYHGWSFSGDGRCTAIPQASEGQSFGARSRCRAHATATAQGLLFVFSGDPDQAGATPLPLVPVLDEDERGRWRDGWFVQDTFRDLPMDALTLLENVLDVSHVPFTHHATVGRRENAGPVELELTGFGPQGFTGLWAEGPRQGKLGSQNTTFAAPCLMWHDLTAPSFARILTVVYATPIRRGECRLFARFPFQFRSPWPARLLALRPQWLQHIGNHTVLEDDQLFLHWQERVLERRGGSAELSRSCHLPTGADLYVRSLHDWVNRHGGEPFPGQALPPRLDREALMEREQAHTRHCRSCSGALRRLRLVRRICEAVVVAGLALAAVLPAVGARLIALMLVLAAVLLRARCLGWIEGLRRGSGLPPRNRR